MTIEMKEATYTGNGYKIAVSANNTIEVTNVFGDKYQGKLYDGGKISMKTASGLSYAMMALKNITR